MKANRIESLDSLRGISALIVVVFHCLIAFVVFANAINFQFENEFIKFLTLSPLKVLWSGNEAVLLFFVLSGFVLTLPMLNGKQQRYTVYITKRFFRIYIPYIVMMAVSTILAIVFMEYKDSTGLSAHYEARWNHDVTKSAVIAYILMINYELTNVNGVVWSLIHEMRISIIFPFVAYIIYKLNFFKSFFVIFIGWALCYVGVNYINNTVDFGKYAIVTGNIGQTVWYSLFFFAGSFLAKYIQLFSFLKKTHPFIKFIVFAIAILLINAKSMLYMIGIASYKMPQIIALFGILILFIFVLNSKLADEWLTRRPILWLGKVSYSLYLVHIPVIMVTTIVLGKVIPMVWAFVLAIGLSILAAGIVYRLVEVPSIHLGKKVSMMFVKGQK
ncbi:acyltransferase family protein [Lysinibacillus antri]|uniref:Acyltransferase n=1 Tax=Lysinibacillus antri TaxID=2498145 RepID=A0A3S0RVZ3_9BACI|nr:acyltransferase [Lysinibacillus antri]RUL53202.1 acyltransferase [Lysinibacillus antri]